MTIKRYDGNCFWKDGLENAPALSLFETIKNEMTDWDVKVDYVSFDEIQVASVETPAQFILINNERGYVLNGEVSLANEVNVYRYNLDYISTFFLPFLSNLQTQPLYMYALRAPFFDAKSAIQNDDEKIRAVNKVGVYNYGKNYYYKESTTNGGQNVVRCYDNYTKGDAQNYLEYSSTDNIVNGCLYFVFTDGDNGNYRFIPVLAKEGTIVYGENAEQSTTEPEHTYYVTINGTNPYLIMPNYQEFIDGNYYFTNRNCRCYGLTKSYNFRDVKLMNGTNPTSKFPSTLTSSQLETLLDEYAGIAYLTFPNYGGEDTSNEKYTRCLNDGVTSTQKFYLDGNTVANSTLNVYWSMTKNTSIDNHYYNEFDITEKNIYNRLLVDSQFRYLNYAQNGTNNHNGTFGFTEYFPSYATVYYVQGRVATPGQANAAIVKAFDFSMNHHPFYIYEVINNYNMYLYPSSQSYKLLKCNNSTQIDSKVYENTDLCYKYILVAPYKIDISLREYQYNTNNIHYQTTQSYQGTKFFGGDGKQYTPFFPLFPTYYFVNNSDTYNATTANYNEFKYVCIAPNITATVRGTPGSANPTPTKILSTYSSSADFYYGVDLIKRGQSQSTTSLKITFPQKTTVINNRKTINNSWNTLYQYATTYNNGNGDAAQFLGIYMLPHMFAFPNSVKKLRTRGSNQFLELDLPTDGVDIKPFKFINGANFNFSNPTPSKILHPNNTNIKPTWWYFTKYSDVLYMNNDLHPEYYFYQYNQMLSDGWFCFNGTGTYIDKLQMLSLKACVWTLPNQLPSFTNTYATYVQSTINSANTSYKVAKNNMIAGLTGGLLNMAASAAVGFFSMGMGSALSGALGEIGGIAGGIGRTAENVSKMTGFVTNNKIKMSNMMGASQLTSGALKNSGGLISSIVGFKNRQMEIKANYADAKNKLQNKLNPSTSDDIALLEQWVGENAQYNVVEYFYPDEITYRQWNSVLYYYSFKLNKNDYSNVLFNEYNWTMFDDCVYFVFDDEMMKSKIQSYQPFNNLYSEVKKYIYELLTNGFRLWRRKPEECEL